MIPAKADIEAAYARVKPYVHRTPVLTSSLINKHINAEVFFKCENFQKMGAFKMRGAVNAILQLSEEERKAGVVTHSSGNFAQAVALAARTLGVQAYIVMPSNAPGVKKEAVKGYGGIITESLPSLEDRERAAVEIKRETGATFLHPSNQMEVILGNATATLELLESHPDLDTVITPVGGGGLLAGTALAVHYFGNRCMTIAGEPFAADDAYRSFHAGQIETNTTAITIADGLRTQLGSVNFPIIKELVTDILRVEEAEIVDSMRYLWERLKIVIEPSSAVPFAALLRHKEQFRNKKIGILLSGGNVSLSQLPF
ncbi:pyridoxal-phosphate dependent enzyme [Altibacter sp.]|uniref:pyridoxal-phosphate dependent enzyme n=1 Tax=Altibacter sp. TaxID=2024823 RepID=UPI002583A79C|nr:pyridoxal-phosphate dependent enzyme [Altibacter sp.]MCW9036695.1 pyridoxal-phosphate dependent enzyme [Altibacter sp.]